VNTLSLTHDIVLFDLCCLWLCVCVCVLSSITYQRELVQYAQQLPNILVREMLPIFKCTLECDHIGSGMQEERIILDDSSMLELSSTNSASSFPFTACIGEELALICRLTSFLPEAQMVRKICVRLISFDSESKMPLHTDDINIVVRDQLVEPGENVIVLTTLVCGAELLLFGLLFLKASIHNTIRLPGD
jgi:hypothetical protein